MHTGYALIFALLTISASGNSSLPGPLQVDVRFEPEQVDPARYFFVTVAVTTPRAGIEIRLPPLSDRFEGFEVMGSYDQLAAAPGGGERLERIVRLRPQPGAPRYRMAPLAIAWHDPALTDDGNSGYQLVPAVRFEHVARLPGAAADIGGLKRLPWFHEISPLRIAVTVGLTAALVVSVGLWIRRRRRPTPPPTPRERAHAELRALLERRLAEQGYLGDFYVELTMVVRRFIERTSRIRAPEQTTREFLDAVRDDALFPPAWTAAIRNFLESADLVKYAAQRPDTETVSAAVRAAEFLIDTPLTEGDGDVATG